MSRPRTPYGSDRPGRLPATMIKVLAAEMSDQQRLARGKRYHSDAAVIDLVIGHGVLTAEVQGSRPEPYVVTIEADGGDGVPTRREIWAQCTCPDDGSGTGLCKHGVAALFALSDEVSIEPALLARWRTGRRRGGSGSNVTQLPTPEPDGRDDDRDDDRADDRADDIPGATVIPIRRERDQRDERRPVDDGWGTLPALLAAPGGAAPPDFPDVDHVDHRSLRDDLLRQVLDDALDHLMLRWD